MDPYLELYTSIRESLENVCEPDGYPAELEALTDEAQAAQIIDYTDCGHGWLDQEELLRQATVIVHTWRAARLPA
jgi:hypothetical protein